MTRLLAAVVIMLVIGACATSDVPPAGSEALPEDRDGATAQQVVAEGVARETPQDAPVDAAVQGMTRFGHDLYQVIPALERNTVLSPLSIAYAFAMARAGARGETAEQIDAVLHLPDAGLHAAVNTLDQQIVTADAPPPRPSPEATETADGPPEPPVVSIANGLFAQQGQPVEEAFLETLAAQYGVGVRTVDFTQPDAAKSTIDAWVRQQTAERIKQLFNSLDPNTKLVLANAVYLKADWATPFAENPTKDAPFTLADGTTVQAPTMHRLDTMRYTTGDGWQAVELPYAGDELAMWVLVPTGDTPLADLLAPDTLAAVDAGLAEGTVDLYLPRWDFATDLDLVPPLQQLGMQVPFTAQADFSGMIDGVWISQAIHRANITVDEWGTEAAAVTGLAFEVSGPPQPDVTIRADRPFAFVVRHTPTGAPLFLGHVTDPTVSAAATG
ncbi:MAG: serpin family protein [Actinomycetota bacterium]|nr:serpin family protein [Actinomycetota bacterium]